MANYWGDGPGNEVLKPFIAAAFKLYRNYDGKGASFGDTAVRADVDNLDKASIYAATDSSRPHLLTVLVINKDQQTIFAGKVTIDGVKYQKAQIYVLNASSPEIKSREPLDIKDNQIAYSLQPLSATLFVCEKRP
jgi:mannan endo-1,4-beta-mannosidase